MASAAAILCAAHALVPLARPAHAPASPRVASRPLPPHRPLHSGAAAAPRHAAMCMAEDADRKETIQAVSIAGGLFGGCFAVYYGATAAGLDEVLAGQLVLLALVAFGSVLVFFDGGVTQASLEANAVRQMAAEEGQIMRKAPREPLLRSGGLPAQDWDAKLRSEGVLQLDGVLPADAAAALVTHVDRRLKEGVAAVSADEMRSYQYFGNVLCRNNRYDVKLPLDPPVEAALLAVLERMRPLLCATLGDDAELFELAALVSDPGAPRQPLHPDTPRRDDADAPGVLTTFVALQPIDEEMGPTVFLPRSQSAAAHAAFNAGEGSAEKQKLLAESPQALGLLSTGDASVFDSRLLHAGGANSSPRRRVLFYFSFKSAAARPPPGTMLTALRGRKLSELGEARVPA